MNCAFQENVSKDVKVIGSKRSEKRLLRHAQAEATSFEGTSDNSLKVPTISHLVPAVPKRPTHSDEEPSLDSRIRRVSMILMSRQHQSQNESKCLTQLEHGDALTSHAVDNEGAALHPEMSTARDLPRTITTRQITEEWPLVSLSEDKKKIPIVKSIDRTEISYMPIKQPNVKPDIHQIEEDMRFRRSRRQTERFSKGIGYHLGRRRRLLELRRRMADFSLAFGLFGIFAAFLDTELVARALYSKDSIYSIIVRVLISVSTVILMALILSYHAYDIMIFLCEEYIKDWRISVTKRRVLQVTIELIICSIHPTPGINLFYYKPQAAKPITSFHPRLHDAPLLEDSFSPYLLLVLPMIGRLYLAFRALLLHSKMFNDAGSRSIGAMNKVSFDLRFVLKTLMTVCPLKSLLIFIFTIWIILSWTLRACELEQGENHLGLLNSAWLISVTFLSIGYGDIVPHTSCGRLVAVTTGLMVSSLQGTC
ncbi:unnamed protein product [Dicrocoelium dendriticum]|nr:unnamed protein product [Dicrocoelium dendriticum]